MEQVTELRCKSCGGPLDGNGDMLVCRYCGTAQQRIDAQKYIEQAKMEMMAWLSNAVPKGFNINQTETMDPVARHSIYANSIKPNIDSSFRNYKFGYKTALSNQLIAMPFRILNSSQARFDPKELFEFDSKLKSVEPLVMDNEEKKMLEEASAMSTSYAMILNNIALLSSDGMDRYQLMANNFRSAADITKGVKGYEIPNKRFEALYTACKGINGILGNDIYFSPTTLQQSIDMLEEVKKDAMKDLDYMSNSLGIDREIKVCRIARMMSNAIVSAPNLNRVAIFTALSNLIVEANRESHMKSSKLTTLNRLDRFENLIEEFCKILQAKSGTPAITVASGIGPVLVPMWPVEIKYSFITGTLFSKHSVEVSELILISADLTTSEKTLESPRIATTDIFKAMPETTFMQRVTGNEKSISMGGCIRDIVNGSRKSAVLSSIRVIAPTTTREEAETIANWYLNESKSTHSKLQMGRATAKDLIYVPCELTTDGIRLGVQMNKLAPSSMGDIETISKIII